jgi:hypothetical protein
MKKNDFCFQNQSEESHEFYLFRWKNRFINSEHSFSNTPLVFLVLGCRTLEL